MPPQSLRKNRRLSNKELEFNSMSLTDSSLAERSSTTEKKDLEMLEPEKADRPDMAEKADLGDNLQEFLG